MCGSSVLVNIGVDRVDDTEYVMEDWPGGGGGFFLVT